ncbi:MAG: preprotein translocase subunit YajC [Ignavibacteriae bacterium]|nr:preprotein translocase subunit YajC [Ignavibacteriota bacterium]
MNLIIGIILQQQGGFEQLLSTIVPFLLIILVFYFLILRPQQKRQKERQKLLESVKKGDKVISTGGIHGVVEGVEDKSVLVKIDDNVKVKMEKSAISVIMGVTDRTPDKK